MAGVPPSRREPVVDHYHGVEVADPYRWLEDGESAEVTAWVAAQNERTQAALESRPDRGPWHERLVALLAATSSVNVRVAGGQVFTLERGGGARQFSLMVRDGGGGTPRVLVDPGVAHDDPTAAIDWYHPSTDGRLVAYGYSAGGDERSTLLVVDVGSGTVLDERIPDTRACSVGWLPDNSGFLYTRYPAGDEYNRTVHQHTLGRPY